MEGIGISLCVPKRVGGVLLMESVGIDPAKFNKISTSLTGVLIIIFAQLHHTYSISSNIHRHTYIQNDTSVDVMDIRGRGETDMHDLNMWIHARRKVMKFAHPKWTKSQFSTFFLSKNGSFVWNQEQVSRESINPTTPTSAWFPSKYKATWKKKKRTEN